MKTKTEQQQLGSADAFGLNEWGDPARPIGPVWGVITGGAVGTTTTLLVKEFADKPKVLKFAEAIGFGAAMVPTIGMFAWRRTRKGAAVGSLFAALLNHGPRFFRDLLSDRAAAEQRVAALLAVSSAAQQAQQAQQQPVKQGADGFGIVQIQPTAALMPGMSGGSPFGLVVPEQTAALGAGPHPELPSLVGTAFGQAQRDLSVIGGPMAASLLSDLGSRFGSTHFNKQ